MILDMPSQRYALRMLGIDIPFTPSAQATFRLIYSPLLRWEASQVPPKIIRGTLHYIDLDKMQLSIAVPGETYDISCLFGEPLQGALKRLSLGDEVSARVGYSPGDFPHNLNNTLGDSRKLGFELRQELREGIFLEGDNTRHSMEVER